MKLRQPEPYPLFMEKKDIRKETCKKYAAKVWRLNDDDKITDALLLLYEEAYSKGAADREKLHQKLDNEPQGQGK